MEKTLEQMKQDLAAAQEAVAAQEKLVREQEREAHLAVERAKWVLQRKAAADSRQALLVKVNAALDDCGIPTTIRPAKNLEGTSEWEYLPTLKIDAPYDFMSIDFETAYSGGSTWSRGHATGIKLVVYQGYGENKRHYPPTKTGYSYAKIAAVIKEAYAARIAAVKAKQAEEAKKVTGQVLADQLKAEGITNVSATISKSYPRGPNRGHEYHEYTATPGRVYMTIGTHLVTPEQARILHKALAEVAALEERSAV